MKTTVEINDALARRVRRLMAKRKVTMRTLIEEGLRKVVEEESETRERFCLRDASVSGDGLREGVQDLSWESMSQFLYPDR